MSCRSQHRPISLSIYQPMAAECAGLSPALPPPPCAVPPDLRWTVLRLQEEAAVIQFHLLFSSFEAGPDAILWVLPPFARHRWCTPGLEDGLRAPPWNFQCRVLPASLCMAAASRGNTCAAMPVQVRGGGGGGASG